MGSNIEDEKKALPRILESIVNTFTPRTLRDELNRDFRATYKSPKQLVRKAVRVLSRVIPGHVWNTTNGALISGQLFAMVVCFLGAPFSIGLAAGFVGGLIILCLRDGHTYPSETPREALTDAIVVVLFIVALQLFTAYMTRQPAIPRDVMWRGSGAALTMLFVLRMITRDPKPGTPRENAERCFRVVFAMNVMWLLTWIGLVLTSPESLVPGLDFIFGFVPPVIVAMDIRLRQDSLSSPNFEKPQGLNRNPERDGLVRKLNWMWLPKSILSELLFFTVVAAQWIGGIVTHPAGDRLRVSANGAALFMLFVVWRLLRRANRTAGTLLQAEIDKLDKAEKK
jgi:hypothetical protein